MSQSPRRSISEPDFAYPAYPVLYPNRDMYICILLGELQSSHICIHSSPTSHLAAQVIKHRAHAGPAPFASPLSELRDIHRPISFRSVAKASMQIATPPTPPALPNWNSYFFQSLFSYLQSF